MAGEKIVFCQATWRKDFEDTKRCVTRVSPHVDSTVIVIDQTVTETQKGWLEQNKDKFTLHIVYHEFRDDLPRMRNAYLEKAKQLGADWVCASDPDELYSEQLAENLHSFVEMAEEKGYNMLPVPARDQFENVEWLDDLDLLKEAPGGYRETDYWKPLLFFKLYPDTHYEGVGAEGRVHETLKSSIPWNAKNLPKEYYYVHKKSALKIWRNAARNMFIAGGGDNVGEVNEYWVQLRNICSVLNIDRWSEFETYLKKGEIDDIFKSWLVDALQAPPTNWGTETRETAKYFFAMHPDQITPEIKDRLENPPQLTPQVEIENYVTRTYFEVLGRHPDEQGRKFYTQAILQGDIKKQQLPRILKQSLEYHEKHGAPEGSAEKIRVDVPVDVDVRVSEGLFRKALMKSDVYWQKIKPRLDLGDFMVSSLSVKDRTSLYEWFYRNRHSLSIQDLSEWLSQHRMKPNSVALCVMGYSQVLPMIQEIIQITGEYVDEIHVQGDDFTKKDIQQLEDYGAQVHIQPWEDNFSDYKNKCITPASTEWVLILDHDEIPTPDLAENLREVIEKSNRGKKYNMVKFDVIDIKTVDGEPVSQHRSHDGKALLHLNVPQPYYGNPHIWLKANYYPWKVAQVPLAYRHVKEKGTQLPRSVRNVFLGGER